MKELGAVRKVKKDRDGLFINEQSVDTERYGESSRLLDDFSSFAATPK